MEEAETVEEAVESSRTEAAEPAVEELASGRQPEELEEPQPEAVPETEPDTRPEAVPEAEAAAEEAEAEASRPEAVPESEAEAARPEAVPEDDGGRPEAEGWPDLLEELAVPGRSTQQPEEDGETGEEVEAQEQASPERVEEAAPEDGEVVQEERTAPAESAAEQHPETAEDAEEDVAAPAVEKSAEDVEDAELVEAPADSAAAAASKEAEPAAATPEAGPPEEDLMQSFRRDPFGTKIHKAHAGADLVEPAVPEAELQSPEPVSEEFRHDPFASKKKVGRSPQGHHHGFGVEGYEKEDHDTAQEPEPEGISSTAAAATSVTEAVSDEPVAAAAWGDVGDLDMGGLLADLCKDAGAAPSSAAEERAPSAGAASSSSPMAAVPAQLVLESAITGTTQATDSVGAWGDFDSDFEEAAAAAGSSSSPAPAAQPPAPAAPAVEAAEPEVGEAPKEPSQCNGESMSSWVMLSEEQRGTSGEDSAAPTAGDYSGLLQEPAAPSQEAATSATSEEVPASAKAGFNSFFDGPLLGPTEDGSKVEDSAGLAALREELEKLREANTALHQRLDGSEVEVRNLLEGRAKLEQELEEVRGAATAIEQELRAELSSEAARRQLAEVELTTPRQQEPSKEILARLEEAEAKRKEAEERAAALEQKVEALQQAAQEAPAARQAPIGSEGEEFNLPDFVWSCGNSEVMAYVQGLVGENAALRRQAETASQGSAAEPQAPQTSLATHLEGPEVTA